MTDTRYVKKEIKDTLNKRKVCFYCNRKVAHKTDKKYYINAIEGN